jgi:DNA uptake protein ComE-like DNA-binding protein
MPYLKRKTKYSILAFLAIVLSITISISTLAKTEVYFSLYDNPQKEITKNINQAQAYINIAMYTFTDQEIALSLSNAQNRGVKVRVYLDRSQIESTYSVSRLLVQKGLKVRISTNNYIMHHKFAIIDNRLLLTGSYNWTAAANNKNDENLMVIDDPEVIARYQNQFEKLWFEKYSLERTRQLFQKANVNFTLTLLNSSDLESKTININTAYQDEFVKVLQISELLAQKIIALREELGRFKDPKDLTQLPEITNLEWKEWIEEGIIINIK